MNEPSEYDGERMVRAYRARLERTERAWEAAIITLAIAAALAAIVGGAWWVWVTFFGGTD